MIQVLCDNCSQVVDIADTYPEGEVICCCCQGERVHSLLGCCFFPEMFEE